MSRHKIVAFRLTEKDSVMTLEALTESPRGTKVVFDSARFDKEKEDKEAFKHQLEQAVEMLSKGAQ